MSRRHSPLSLLLAATALAAAIGATLFHRAAAAEPPAPTANETCVLSNPAYSGKCTVTVDVPKGSTGLAACREVLGCLNDSRCLRTWCNATTVRGGWKLESPAEPPK